MTTDTRWTRLTLLGPTNPTLSAQEVSHHISAELGSKPNEAFSWTITSQDPNGYLTLETHQDDRFSAHTLHFHTTTGATQAQGPTWLKRLGMALFKPLGARLGFGRAVAEGLEYPVGLRLEALVWPWRGAVFLDAQYRAWVEELTQFNSIPTFWTTEEFGTDGACCMCWPGWFGASGEEPLGAHWPWDVDLPVPKHERYNQLSAVGFGRFPALDVTAERLGHWLRSNPTLDFGTQPRGLSIGAWLLLATARCVEGMDTHGFISRAGELLVPFRSILNDPYLTTLTALAACRVLPLTYLGRRSLALVVAPDEERCIELHFMLEPEDADDLDYKGEPWQWPIICSLVESVLGLRWVGALWPYTVGMYTVDLDDPDVLSICSFIARNDQGNSHIKPCNGWHESLSGH